MPVLSVPAKNFALNGIPIAACSLHDNYSPNGEFEIDRYNEDPDNPTYIRVEPIMNPADSALVTSQTSFTFGVPANVTVRFLGLWDGVGTFLGMMPVGGLSPRLYMLDADLTTFIVPGNVFSDDTQIVFWPGAGLQLPLTPTFVDIQEGFIYWVINATIESFQISNVQQGPPLLFNSRTGGYVQQITPQSFVLPGTFPISLIAIDATIGT